MPIDRREFLHAVAVLGATARLGAPWPTPSPQTSMLTRQIPRTGEEMVFTSELPADLRAALEAARKSG